MQSLSFPSMGLTVEFKSPRDLTRNGTLTSSVGPASHTRLPCRSTTLQLSGSMVPTRLVRTTSVFFVEASRIKSPLARNWLVTTATLEKTASSARRTPKTSANLKILRNECELAKRQWTRGSRLFVVSKMCGATTSANTRLPLRPYASSANTSWKTAPTCSMSNKLL